MKWVLIILTLSLLPFSVAYAKGKSLVDYSQVFYLSGNLLFADATANKLEGATYTKELANPIVGAAGLGVRVLGFFYLGIRYEHWFGGRQFSDNGVPQEDTLKFSSLGGEAGIYRGNPRFYWTVTGGYFLPLSLSVSSTRASDPSTYVSAAKAITYQARLTVGVKLSSRFSFRLEGGYRIANLGDLMDNGDSLLPHGASLDLSGPFVGAGLGLHF